MSRSVQDVIAKIKDWGWSVEKEEDRVYRIGRYSPAGQDFTRVIKGESVKELLDNIYQAYEDFDVSYETYLWLDDAGHGVNGAPYDMRDLYNDMESCKNMLLDLYDDLDHYIMFS